VNELQIEEAQLLRLNDDGQIQELTLFGPPLPGLTAVMAGIGPALLRRLGQATLAPLVGAAVAPLATLTRLGERYLVPLGDPSRSTSHQELHRPDQGTTTTIGASRRPTRRRPREPAIW